MIRKIKNELAYYVAYLLPKRVVYMVICRVANSNRRHKKTLEEIAMRWEEQYD